MVHIIWAAWERAISPERIFAFLTSSRQVLFSTWWLQSLAHGSLTGEFSSLLWSL